MTWPDGSRRLKLSEMEKRERRLEKAVNLLTLLCRSIFPPIVSGQALYFDK